MYRHGQQTTHTPGCVKALCQVKSTGVAAQFGATRPQLQYRQVAVVNVVDGIGQRGLIILLPLDPAAQAVVAGLRPSCAVTDRAQTVFIIPNVLFAIQTSQTAVGIVGRSAGAGDRRILVEAVGRVAGDTTVGSSAEAIAGGIVTVAEIIAAAGIGIDQLAAGIIVVLAHRVVQ